ncbi:MAG TPA: hypothetical protein VMU46_01855, partial [Burkholderiales bacterium]|nr:hypothetical protein [Burkholderiales bacterium]
MRINGLSMIWRICGATLLAGLLFGTAAFAQAPIPFGAILVTDASGRLGFRIGEGAPQPVVIGQIIPVGARIITGPDAQLVLRFPDEQVVVLGPRSRLILREYRYLPRDLGNSRVLFNLTDGTVNIVMGEIGQHDPGLVQIQVGTKSIEQAPQRAREAARDQLQLAVHGAPPPAAEADAACAPMPGADRTSACRELSG